MYNNFGREVSNILKKAEEERFSLHHPYVGTEHLLLAILKFDPEMTAFFQNFNLNYEKFKKELVMVVGMAKKESELNLYTPLLKRVICNALNNAKENNNGIVTSKHLLISLLEEGEGIAVRLLVGMNIDIDDVYEALNKNTKLVNKKLEIYETGVLFNEIIDMNEVVVGRDKEINSIIETLLRKKKNNPILIGDAGVGKTAIIEELTRRIERKEVPESMFNVKIVSLEMGALVSGTKYRGEFEEKLTKIIKELEENPNIILFIDEIHSMVSAGGAEGAITAGDIFKPALARGKIKCIGATTTHEYNKFFANDKALMRRFEVINVCEPNIKETKDILIKVKKEYEKHHNVVIPNKILDSILTYTDNFMKLKKNPDKAIDFLDSVCSKVKTNCHNSNKKKYLYQKLDMLKNDKNKSIKNNDYDEALKIYNEEIELEAKINDLNCHTTPTITEKDVIDVLENKTNMIFNKDKLKFLDNMLVTLDKEFFNSHNYLKQIVEDIKNNLLNKKGFLKIYLEGGIGLGKSTIVKRIKDYFPQVNFLRIDLKEFKSPLDISKLIGTTQGYVGYNDEHLLNSVKTNNFTIILFDNYDEACHNIKDLIKEILKEGYITDNKGEKIYFNNSFIFITNDTINSSNIGFNNNGNKQEYNELYDLVDDTIKFHNLTKDELIKYLDYKKVTNKEQIIKECNYEKYNYQNIAKFLKNNNLINN